MTFTVSDDAARDQYAVDALRNGRDPLTGVLARARLREDLVRALAAAERYGEPVSVCVLDLDNFRHVNEAHGHPTGDHLLAVVAHALTGRLRATDSLGRIGADEFAIVLPRTDLEAARAVAADLLVALRDRAHARGAVQGVRLTASIGVACVAGGERVDPTELLAQADLAMIAAKEAGRDRLCVATAGSTGGSSATCPAAWSTS